MFMRRCLYLGIGCFVYATEFAPTIDPTSANFWACLFAWPLVLVVYHWMVILGLVVAAAVMDGISLIFTGLTLDKACPRLTDVLTKFANGRNP